MVFDVEFISLKGSFASQFLGRKVNFRLVAPPTYRTSDLPFPVMLMNDGQDFRSMGLERILTDAYSNNRITPFIYVGLETNENRMHEYGTASSADYKGRGEKAILYSRFITEEFIPFLKKEFKVASPKEAWVFVECHSVASLPSILSLTIHISLTKPLFLAVLSGGAKRHM